MSDRGNVVLVAAASALAGAKIQDIVKSILDRRRRAELGVVEEPVSSSKLARSLPTPRTPDPVTPMKHPMTGPKTGPETGVSSDPETQLIVCPKCGEDDVHSFTGASPVKTRMSLTNTRYASSVSKETTHDQKPDPYLAAGRDCYLSWDDYFMSVAFLSAQRSKDPNKQVGAVIVGPEKVICGVGYNGFPRGCADNALPWSKKSKNADPMETKYAYVCHAEMNAIMNKNAQNLRGASLYVTMYPCNECAKLIIQSGIREVIYFEGKDVAGKPPSVETRARGATAGPTDGGSGETNAGAQTPTAPSPGVARPNPVYAAAGILLKLADVKIRQHTPRVSVDVTYSYE
jgi:dCMP deaminase